MPYDVPSSSPIVGANFRKPAPAIIQAMVTGQALLLEREPTNPYDENAVKVLVDLNTLLDNKEFWEEIDSALDRAGVNREELLSAPFHLGFIDSSKTGHAAIISAALAAGMPGTASLGFDGATGKPVSLIAESNAGEGDDE